MAAGGVMERMLCPRVRRRRCGGMAAPRPNDYGPPRSEGWGGEPRRMAMVAQPRVIVAASES